MGALSIVGLSDEWCEPGYLKAAQPTAISLGISAGKLDVVVGFLVFLTVEQDNRQLPERVVLQDTAPRVADSTQQQVFLSGFWLVLVGIEIGQRTGDDAVVAFTLPQLWEIVFKHLDGLIHFSLFAGVGGQVEDVVVRVVWRNLEYLLSVVLHTVDIGREERGEVGHLRAEEV